MVEISCHGSPVVLKEVIRLLVAAGARLAEPGEFSLRAFLNGRMDLAQAEAIRDLIHAQTTYQAQACCAPTERRTIETITSAQGSTDRAHRPLRIGRRIRRRQS